MTIDPALLAAYLIAEYAVFSEDPFVFKIGERSAELDALLEASGAESAAFVTAANPRGERANPRDNALSTEALLQAQREAGYACLPGAGRDSAGQWPVEPSVLVLGITRREAEILGRSYEQNAIVFMTRGGVPELVLLA